MCMSKETAVSFQMPMRGHSACVTKTHDSAKQYTTHQRRQKHKHGTTPRAGVWGESPLARSRRGRLIRLNEYRMRQWTTAVDQPILLPVFNTADNTLNGFDVSRVQGPSLLIIRDRQYPMSIGEFSMDLSNNRKTKIFRFLRFKLFTFRNGDDDDVLKLPKKRS